MCNAIVLCGFSVGWTRTTGQDLIISSSGAASSFTLSSRSSSTVILASMTTSTREPQRPLCRRPTSGSHCCSRSSSSSFQSWPSDSTMLTPDQPLLTKSGSSRRSERSGNWPEFESCDGAQRYDRASVRLDDQVMHFLIRKDLES